MYKELGFTKIAAKPSFGATKRLLQHLKDNNIPIKRTNKAYSEYHVDVPAIDITRKSMFTSPRTALFHETGHWKDIAGNGSVYTPEQSMMGHPRLMVREGRANVQAMKLLKKMDGKEAVKTYKKEFIPINEMGYTPYMDPSQSPKDFFKFLANKLRQKFI